MHLPKSILLISLFSLISVCSFAAESQFGFVYTTDLLPKGQKEIEQWLTLRNQKVGGTFDLLEGKTAYEYGASDDIQLSLYTTYDWTQAYHNGPMNATTPPEPFSYDQPGPNDFYSVTKFIGISFEGIYRVLSPYIDPFGLAFYLEPTFGDRFVELDSKIILQKNYLDDTLTFAFNFSYAPEFRQISPPGENDDQAWQEETDVNYDLGASYRFVPNWWAGLEVLNEQERNNLNFEDLTNCGYFIGPNIHYGGKDFFVTLLLMTQLPWATTHIATVPGAIVNGYDFDNDFEKYRVRIKTGFYF